ncbi:unnamed protein product [Didymodactylos carnosus]|nr:unnamed protein product [Didymodactylos carnosus]CAF4165528.1 unnamed protein product [Didymodactylos carnosus]
MFKAADTNAKGYLTQEEFQKILRYCDISLDNENFYHVFAELDKNPMDGKIQYGEFYVGLIFDALAP